MFGVFLFCLYFIIHFVFTQKIYSRNYFIVAITFSLIVPGISFFMANDKKYWLNQVLPLTLLNFFYIVLLIIVKIVYKNVNAFLIKKAMVKKEYSEKDFTYVMWDGDGIIPSWWDEKLASKPSWLDYIITYSLFVFPILLLIVWGKWWQID